MQPFALFRLFQSLLPQAADSPSPEQENPAPTPAETEPVPSPVIDSKQEAVLNFLSAHDARAKRTKH